MPLRRAINAIGFKALTEISRGLPLTVSGVILPLRCEAKLCGFRQPEMHRSRPIALRKDLALTDMSKRLANSAFRRAVLALASLVSADLAIDSRDARAFEHSASGQAITSQLPTLQGIEISPPAGNRGAGVELTLPSTALGGNANNNGSGLVIPGLGSLPKLDFGLELLYGSPDQSSPAPDQSDALPNALTVHGAVKKTF